MKRYKNILRWFLTTICIIYLIRFFYKNHDSLQMVFNCRVSTIFYIVVLQIIYYLLQSCRFQIVIHKCSHRKVPFWPWLKIFILGRFLNTVVSQLGNIYRSVHLKQDYQISYTRYISGFTSMAWMDTSMNLIIATGVVVIFSPGFLLGPFLAWKILLLMTTLVIILPCLAEFVMRKITFSNSYAAWVHAKLSEVLSTSLQNLKDSTYLVQFILLGLALFIRTCIMLHIYFNIFDVQVSLPALIVFYSLFKLSFYFVLTPGNLGIQEIAFGFLSEQMGIGMEKGIYVSVFIRIVGMLMISVLGLTFGGADLLRHRKKFTAQKS